MTVKDRHRCQKTVRGCDVTESSCGRCGGGDGGGEGLDPGAALGVQQCGVENASAGGDGVAAGGLLHVPSDGKGDLQETRHANAQHNPVCAAVESSSRSHLCDGAASDMEVKSGRHPS